MNSDPELRAAVREELSNAVSEEESQRRRAALVRSVGVGAAIQMGFLVMLSTLDKLTYSAAVSGTVAVAYFYAILVRDNLRMYRPRSATGIPDDLVDHVVRHRVRCRSCRTFLPRGSWECSRCRVSFPGLSRHFFIVLPVVVLGLIVALTILVSRPLR